MFSKLRMLARELPTLAHHAEAYAELAAEELGSATRQWTMRVAGLACALVVALLALVLGGVALLLWGALPQEPSAPARWLLWALPLGLAIVAAIVASVARSLPRQPAFAELRSQWRQDMALVRGEAAAPAPSSREPSSPHPQVAMP